MECPTTWWAAGRNQVDHRGKMRRAWAPMPMLLLLLTCGGSTETTNKARTTIGRETAIRVAREDATAAYGKLDTYEVKSELVHAGWEIRFVLRDKKVDGGGASYLIDASNGKILRKQYAQ
jgi:hypothetical protein